MAFQCPGCDTAFSPCIDFVLDFSWSSSKKIWKKIYHDILMPWNSFIDFIYVFFSYIYFVLNFSWSFRKTGNWKKSLTAFQCPGCDKTYSSCIDFVLEFSWSFSKNWKKPFIAFQCPGCDTMFASFIDFVLDFLWSFRKKTGRNLSWHFNALKFFHLFYIDPKEKDITTLNRIKALME